MNEATNGMAIYHKDPLKVRSFGDVHGTDFSLDLRAPDAGIFSRHGKVCAPAPQRYS